MANDLEYVATKDLLDELKRRHDVGVFFGWTAPVKDPFKRGSAWDFSELTWGNVALGLAALDRLYAVLSELSDASWPEAREDEEEGYVPPHDDDADDDQMSESPS